MKNFILLISVLTITLTAAFSFAEPTQKSLNEQNVVLTGIEKEISILETYRNKAARRIATLADEYDRVYEQCQQAASRSQASQAFSLSSISAISNMARSQNSSDRAAQQQLNYELNRIRADHARWCAEYDDFNEQIQKLNNRYNPLLEQFDKELKEYKSLSQKTHNEYSQKDAYKEIALFGQTHKLMKYVRNDMADLLDEAAARNQPMTLQEAYDIALANNPEVRKLYN